MPFTQPEPFTEALQKLRSRQIIPLAATTAQWAQMATELRERAFFSARVESAILLQAMQNYLTDYLAGTRLPDGSLKAHSRAEFVANMRQLAIQQGLGKIDPQTGQINPEIIESDLTDIRSLARLQLIFDTQTEAAQEYGYWRQGQDPHILHVYPAQRFIRVRPVKVPRDYHQAALGLVARKDDLKLWLSLNRDFNVPWGPWGFNSGCGVEDVDRLEALALGVIKETDTIQPLTHKFNHNFQVSTRSLEKDILAALTRTTGGTLAGTTLKPRAIPAKKPDRKGMPKPLKNILIKIGLIDPKNEDFKEMNFSQAQKLFTALHKKKPVEAHVKIEKITGTVRKGSKSIWTKQSVMDMVQEFFNLLPPETVEALPSITIRCLKTLPGLGQYNFIDHVLELNKTALSHPEDARKTLFHELLHWVHEHGPQAFRKEIQELWDRRTKGEELKMLAPYWRPSIVGHKDMFADLDGDEYAGRVYPWELRKGKKPKGTELVTRHAEKLAQLEKLAPNWNHKASDGSYSWREAFLVALRVFFPY